MKVAVLLSGGVDSSVALALLARQAQCELTAYYLKVWLEEELSFLGDCPWQEDLGYVRAVCEQLDVPLEVVPLQSEYLERVVGHALSELRLGRTPSPDVFCNQRVKFGAFLERLGPAHDKVASGHYARVERRDPAFVLRRSPDPVKDQTYFLSQLRQEQVARLLFPIGHLCKREVRALAADLGLATQARKDSQGICFLGRIPYRQFLRARLGEKAGAVVDRSTGAVLGEHRGYWFYTIGQRHGLGLPGGPWFVDGKDTAGNVVFVTHRALIEERRRDRFAVAELNWIAGVPRNPHLRVKVRHGPHSEECRVEWNGQDRLDVHLAHPDQGIAPGQVAAFYDGDLCLGGGTIE